MSGGRFSFSYSHSSMFDPSMHPPEAQYWDLRYLKGETGWNLNSLSPPLVHFIHSLPETAKNWHILFPGSGESPDPAFWYNNGFKNTFALDFSSEARKLFLDKNPTFPSQQFLCTDFFCLPPENWDLILEQTFFCALPPSLRKDYVEQMYRILKPGALLAGVWFNRHFEQNGPPYGSSVHENIDLFSLGFDIISAEPCSHSVKPRAGTEYWMIFRKIEI